MQPYIYTFDIRECGSRDYGLLTTGQPKEAGRGEQGGQKAGTYESSVFTKTESPASLVDSRLRAHALPP